MTETPRSSSNRVGGVCDAVIVQDQRPAGPLRLPENRVEDFIDHFNRTYQGVGMKLDPVQPDRPAGESIGPDHSSTLDSRENKKIPASSEADGDVVSG